MITRENYDEKHIGTLISEHTNFSHVVQTYKKVVESEIGYRGGHITMKDVLEDTLASAIIIASRGKAGNEDYQVYLDGIRGVTTHIFAEAAAIVADPLLARFEEAGAEYAERLTLSPETITALETKTISALKQSVRWLRNNWEGSRWA